MNRTISRIAAILAIFSLASCTGKVADVEVGPYTVSVIQNNVYHIQDYNASNPAGETFDAEGNVISFNNW